MKEAIKKIAYEWKMEKGESALLKDLLEEMEIPNYSKMDYDGFIHSLARGIMIANKEMGWNGGFAYKN